MYNFSSVINRFIDIVRTAYYYSIFILGIPIYRFWYYFIETFPFDFNHKIKHSTSVCIVECF